MLKGFQIGNQLCPRGVLVDKNYGQSQDSHLDSKIVEKKDFMTWFAPRNQECAIYTLQTNLMDM